MLSNNHEAQGSIPALDTHTPWSTWLVTHAAPHSANSGTLLSFYPLYNSSCFLRWLCCSNQASWNHRDSPTLISKVLQCGPPLTTLLLFLKGCLLQKTCDSDSDGRQAGTPLCAHPFTHSQDTRQWCTGASYTAVGQHRNDFSPKKVHRPRGKKQSLKLARYVTVYLQ